MGDPLALGSAPGLPELSAPSTPALRWSTRSRTIAGIEAELARIWASTSRAVELPDGTVERHVAARTSVLNLVVIARRPELAERAVAAIRGLTARHPSRTLVLSSVDPDGPAALDARIEAYCVLPRADAPETCSESIFLAAGGEAGRRLSAVVAPLLIHDLPVTVWWPGDPPLGAAATRDLLAMADRLIVDGSSWSGDGLDRLAMLAELDLDPRLVVVDFALTRQARWREAIAATFDRPDLRPALRGLRRVEIEYAAPRGATVAAGPATGPVPTTNVVRPLYHAAWLASRLGLGVESRVARTTAGDGYAGWLRTGRRRIEVVLRPRDEAAAGSADHGEPEHHPPGTTLAVRLTASIRGRAVSLDVHARAEAVLVDARIDGRALPERRFLAPRKTEAALLSDALESVAPDPVASATLRMAAALAGGA
jgi:hypothetical protein